MAYQNTGAYRQRTLTIQPKQDGSNFGVPVVFSILSGFVDPLTQDEFLPINSTEFSKITNAAYLVRRDAFLRMVYADPRVSRFVTAESFTNVSDGSSSYSVGLICIQPTGPIEVIPGGGEGS